MKPHEILPEPEDDQESMSPKGIDDFNELAEDRAIESKQSSGQGSTALAGMVIGDASTQVQSVVSSQIADDIGGIASSAIVDVPEDASDIDLIEKAWVHKAKQIVNSTEGDPYVQNQQLTRMKAEYIKKRYNKDININEAA